MTTHHLERHVRHQLEGSHALAAVFAQASEQGHRSGRRRHRQPCRELGLWARKELEHGGRHQPQRTLGADEQMLEVVASIVLAQAAQAVPDAAVGQHNLQTEHQIAHIAVAQHLHAAGVGGDVAADGGRSFRRQRQGEQAVGAGGRLLHLLQDGAGLDRDGVVVGIHMADTVHAGKAYQHLVFVRDAAADQARVAALRHDADAGLGTGGDHRRDFVRSARPDHALRIAAVAAAPVIHIGFDVGPGFEYVLGTDDCGQTLKQARHLS